MAIKSEAQKRAVAKYNAENYERLEIRVPKGDKARIQTHAEALSESVNGFVGRAISETMERDQAAGKGRA